MNTFSINGISRETPVAPERSFRELMGYIRQNFSGENSLISAIKVNGLEITERDETLLAAIPVAQLESIEIFTAHPREMAEETLQTLLRFSEHLEKLSRHNAEMIVRDGHPHAGDLSKLVDGIATFSEALTHAKQLLRIGLNQPIAVLEADLVSILKDVVQYQEQKQYMYVADLLREHLPLNLAEWRTQGIPEMIRSRDS